MVEVAAADIMPFSYVPSLWGSDKASISYRRHTWRAHGFLDEQCLLLALSMLARLLEAPYFHW